MGDVDSGGGYICGGHWNSVFSDQLCCESKTAIKNSLFWEFPGGSVLGLRALTAKGLDLIPDQGTKIPQSTQCGQINKPYSLFLANGPN